jgi:hypothetical protein
MLRVETGMNRRMRRNLAALGAIALVATLGLGGWSFYYGRVDSLCFAGRRTSGCDRFVRLEQFVCDHGLPATNWIVGGCSKLGARYFLGAGVPKDLAKSIAFDRRGCLARLDFLSGASCTMTWSAYSGAFSDPHFLMYWSGHYDGPEYTPNYARPLEIVLAEAEALCANNFDGRSYRADLRELLGRFCDDLLRARPAFEDARDNGPELLRRCESGNPDACLLAGTILSYGIGAQRDVDRGKTLLRRACDKHREIACDAIGASGKAPDRLLELLEAAIAGRPAPPRH